MPAEPVTIGLKLTGIPSQVGLGVAVKFTAVSVGTVTVCVIVHVPLAPLPLLGAATTVSVIVYVPGVRNCEKSVPVPVKVEVPSVITQLTLPVDVILYPARRAEMS